MELRSFEKVLKRPLKFEDLHQRLQYFGGRGPDSEKSVRPANALFE